MKTIQSLIRNVFLRNRYLSQFETEQNQKTKKTILLFVALAFMVMSITNIYARSYVMFAATMFGFLTFVAVPALGARAKKTKIYDNITVAVCAVVFAVFVVVGGNDGFSCLWIALLPIFAMVVLDFSFGLLVSILLQLFLFIVFWTPLSQSLLYPYNEQFCLRFPLYYSVSMILALITTISLQKSQYNERMHLSELERLKENAEKMARSDSLTGLANRRHAYELFAKNFADSTIPHSIVMGDIDQFKRINDYHDHGFGDEVLVMVASYIEKLLPDHYIKARWGGEEFLIAANEPLDRVYEKIEFLRQKISEHEFVHNGEPVKVSMTFGIAEYYCSDSLKDAIITADNRMYIGKNHGRNCTVTKSAAMPPHGEGGVSDHSPADSGKESL